MSEHGLWYLAHPLTALCRDGARDTEAERRNYHLSNVRALALFRAGYNVYSPISHSYPIQCEAGHAEDAQLPWYDLDNEFIAAVDWRGIIMAPRWQYSRGCVAERDLFVALGLPVKFYQDIVEDRP